MATETASISVSNDLSAPSMSRQDMSTSQPIVLDDDSSSSSLSSTGSDIFDQSSDNPSQQEKWRLDINGEWERYGSLGSATSTGISSMSSSVGLEDTASDKLAIPAPSRKRMADGNLKSQSPSADQAPQQATAQSSLLSQFTQPSVIDSHPLVKKKRGRPPKIKTTDNEVHVPPTSVDPSAPKLGRPRKISKPEIKTRPRSSIPSRLSATEFASQCIKAAFASRLDPYALHPGEQELLAERLMSKEVTIYLNIRNAILRLWVENPICTIGIEEAAGCAKESRFFGLAEFAYRWLTRNGYINFGCVLLPRDPSLPKRLGKEIRQRTVAVIGAGVSGLTTARQLESLFNLEAAKWTDAGERPPRVIILEGRNRIGGRVYSKPLRSQVSGSLPDGLRNTAEMGAMIVTGFEHGNPLDIIIRGQLGLRYYLMKDALTIYDCDGSPVDQERDLLNTELYTDISDRAGEYRAEPQKQDTLRGDEDLINRCRDPAPEGFSAFQLEPLPAAHIKAHRPAARRGRRRNAPPGTEKLTGRSQVIEGDSATQSAARAAKDMGWKLKPGVARNQTISLDRVASANAYPTLGAVMDDTITQYRDLVDLTPTDMRLLNWHHANLEYANAAPVSQLSLSGHDQDTGNEFEGAHSEVIGGYTQLPRGLMNLPTKLDVRFERNVESVHYDDGADANGFKSTKIVCTDGEIIEADEVIMTTPLGVLKSNMIDFDPPLPGWKQGAINRMGFGLLNKVILLYDAPFWDDDRDMFGLLNEAEQRASLNPVDYARRRGRFYLLWNCSKISGRPMLIALMAGNAAYDAEGTDTTTLMTEITERLRTVFPVARVPPPLEVIVTRWKKDPFTRGTYSYVGPETRPGDYDLMAKGVGNLHFAGEATCGTHPATVHGAFLSGLRVASDVVDKMAGAITLPVPLVGLGPIKQEFAATANSLPVRPTIPQAPVSQSIGGGKHTTILGTGSFNNALAPTSADLQGPIVKHEEDLIQLSSIPFAESQPIIDGPVKPAGPPAKSVCAKDSSFWVAPSYDSADLDYEAAVVSRILVQVGDRPEKPSRPGTNPFLLFTKQKWEECRQYTATHDKSDKKDIIRRTLGKWWRELTDEAKQPYLDQSQAAQEVADDIRREWETKVAQWDADATRIRREYMREHPPPVSSKGAEGNGVSKRKTNVSNNVVLDHL